MYQVRIEHAEVFIEEIEPIITSGSLNAFSVHYEFDETWNGFTRFAVFRTKFIAAYEVMMDDTNTVDIPWEVLVDHGPELQIGAYGAYVGAHKTVRLPTVWGIANRISEGVIEGMGTRPPTPNVYEQFINALNSIPIAMTRDQVKEILNT